jgi:hypothetical protein
MPIVLYKNIGLKDADTGGQTSTVGEPNVANRGGKIFYTGNWYATRSSDGGHNWDLLSPYNALPPVDGGFCCDQTLIYERSCNILVWLLQYVEKNGTNTLRVAVNPGATLGDNDWHWWDFKPEGVNSDWAGEWFDYNHVATSNNFLYVGTNVFRASNDRFTRSVLFRLPLDTLASGGALNYSYFTTSDNFSLRCTQGARDVMYFGSHNTRSQIRVFSWPENANAISTSNIDITQWNFNPPYTAPGPDGNNWLSRGDPRITGAMVARNVLTFAWTVNASGNRKQPHVRVVRIDAGNMSLLDEPDIWNSNVAFAYAALCPNRRGDTGITLFYGGGNSYPGHVVGVRDEGSGKWDLKATRIGTDGPGDGKWGDYLGIVPNSDYGNTWFASGYTLRGGDSRSDIEPRVVQFGYRRS